MLSEIRKQKPHTVNGFLNDRPYSYEEILNINLERTKKKYEIFSTSDEKVKWSARPPHCRWPVFLLSALCIGKRKYEEAKQRYLFTYLENGRYDACAFQHSILSVGLVYKCNLFFFSFPPWGRFGSVGVRGHVTSTHSSLHMKSYNNISSYNRGSVGVESKKKRKTFNRTR